MENKVELLAPAGNKEAYFGAVNAGADAVYLGGERFSARAYADNFTQDEIIECIKYGHLNHCRTYLTVNTLVKEEEMEEFLQFLVPFYAHGLDGVIVQDIGAATLIHQYFPNMELHISTQMTVTGSNGANYVKDLGAVRVVPARECSLSDVTQMKENSGLEMECFVHGAMCYCYSGQCLMSSVIGGRSGNRGRCAGPCRLPFLPEGQKNRSYPLSLKDLCMVEKIPELIKGGIDSFKIEGRMKKPEYAAGVTSIYRKYIDWFYKNPMEPYKVSRKDLNFLRNLYIRNEIQDGYYFKHNGKEMVTISEGGYNGSEQSVLDEIRSKYIESVKKTKITMKATFICGQKAYLELQAGDTVATVYGEEVQKAQNKGLTVEDIEKQLKKLGNTYFEAEDISVSTDQISFYPVKLLNELRRKAVEELERKLIVKQGYFYEREEVDLASYEAFVSKVEFRENKKASSEQDFSVLITRDEQLKALEHLSVNEKRKIHRIYVEESLTEENPKALEKLKTITKDFSIQVIWALPLIQRQNDSAYEKDTFELLYQDLIQGVLVRNLEQLEYLREHGFKGLVYSDSNLYIWNRASAKQFLKDVHGFTYPVELNRKEERALFENTPLEKVGEKIIYGRLPLMVSSNCIYKTFDSCKGRGVHFSSMEDRKNAHFPIKIDCNHCHNIIFNSVPLSLHKDLDKRYGNVQKRISFIIENTVETESILHYYLQGNETKYQLPIDKFTTGHTVEGVL